MNAFSFLTIVKYLFLYQSCGDVVLGALIPPSTFFVLEAFQSHDLTTIQAFMAHSAELT